LLLTDNQTTLHPFNGLFFQHNLGKPAPESKPFWILMKQEMMGGSGISWTICKSFAPGSRQITMPVPHHSVITGQMPCHPTNSIKAQKALTTKSTNNTQPFYGSVEFVRENPGEPVPEETFTHYSHRSHQSS